MKRIALLLLGTAGLALAQPALAQHGPPPSGETRSLQGDPGNNAWKQDPYMQALYHISVGAFAKGPDKVDFASYQQTFYAIVRAKAVVSGVNPEGMIDHIKDIPRQMIGIVKDNPRTLDSYDNFVVAMVGPGIVGESQQHAQPPHGQHPAPQAQGETKNLQGGNNDAWFENPHIHAFYDLTKETLGKGALTSTSGPAFEAYRDKSYAIFRAFGTSMGGNPDGMVDHLKDIPRQMVGIVKDDPKVLDSFKNFRLALEGPP